MKITILLLGLVLLPAMAQAQELSDRKGSKAVFFGVEGSNTGFDLGGKLWLSNTLAANGRLSYDNSRTQGDIGNTVSVPSGSSFSGGRSNSHYYQFGASAGINRYWRAGTWSPYLGGQVRAAKSWYASKFNSDNTGTRGSYGSQTNTTNFGLDAVAGAEFWVSDSISLGAEYAYGFTYGVSRGDSTSVNSGVSMKTPTKNRGTVIGGQGSTVLLNIYF